MMSRAGQARPAVQVRQARILQGGCYFSFLSSRPVPFSHADWHRGKQQASPKGNGAGSALKLFVPFSCPHRCKAHHDRCGCPLLSSGRLLVTALETPILCGGIHPHWLAYARVLQREGKTWWRGANPPSRRYLPLRSEAAAAAAEDHRVLSVQQ